MAWKFNPFTGTLDYSGGGGGGASYIDGDVEFHADLPVAVGVPPVDSVYIVRKGSGVWLINRKPAGVYVRSTNNGNLDDWTYAGILPDVFSDANFSVYNSADSSKAIKLDVSSVSPSNTRTLAVQDASGTIALSADIPTQLDDLSDVSDLSGAGDGDVLTYNNSTSKWEANTPSGSTDYLVKSAFAAPYNYIGRAALGTAEGDATWDITRIEVASDGSTTVLNATGAWTNRASLSYT
jgi:hypothetical protein